MFASAVVADELLPLRPTVFGILTVLCDGPLHGYGIMKRANEHLGRQALLGPGTLYRTLKEMRELGLLDHAEPMPGEDARRQYYRLSSLGDEVVRAEADRLAELIRSARLDEALSEQRSR